MDDMSIKALEKEVEEMGRITVPTSEGFLHCTMRRTRNTKNVQFTLETLRISRARALEILKDAKY